MVSFFTRSVVLTSLLVLIALPRAGLAQELINEGFESFGAAGFSPTPAADQLDSNTWIAKGLSDNSDPAFGATLTGNDFTRGASTGGVSAGGIYAFDTGSNVILGVQPTGADFTPGSFDLQVTNTTGATAQALSISYQIWVLNNATRSNALNLQFSSDGAVWTPVPELDYSTPEADDALGWTQVDREVVLTGLGLADDAPFFLRWDSVEVSGGGSRDEFGIDNVVVEVVTPPTLEIEKTGPEFTTVGGQITYQISLDNSSTTDAITALTVADMLPADLTYLSNSSGVVPDQSIPGTLSWSFPDLAIGQNLTFDLVLAVDAAAAPGARLNTISATGQAGGSQVDSQSSWETILLNDVSIYDIQTVADPTVDDASPLVGATVQVDGIVTAAPGELEDNRSVVITVIQESAGGPFSGLTLIGDISALNLERGDQIRVVGEVAENFGQTELLVETAQFIQAATLPSFEVLATAGFSAGQPGDSPDSEQWEGVLIEFSDVTVTDTQNFGEWLFDDNSGVARGDDAGVALTIDPAVNDSYGFLRGIGWYSFSNYKVQPRDNDDVDLTPDVQSISAIQGTGLRSPFAPASGNDPGQLVRTEGNIVTAVGSNFFVIQTPDSALPRGVVELSASRGLQVFTGATPTVSVGDEVTVQGPVVEFFDLTQIGNPDLVEVTSSGNSLPLPVTFDDQTPSADPESPSCGVNNFECFESMRVAVADGFVTAPSQRFGSDPVAEAVVSATGERILRGSGVEFPGLGTDCPNCPVWSGAPEQFELDTDRFGGPNPVLAGGTTFSAVGVLGFSFGDYALWATELTDLSVPDLPVEAPTGQAEELTVASLNALDLFDTVQNGPRPIPACGAGYIADDREVPDEATYQLKLDKLADTIIQAMQLPDVIALQEVESLATLQDLADRISTASGAAVTYTPYLEFGNDRGNINNGYLINQARVAVDAIILEGGDECLSSDNTPLHDRPTLTLEARFIADGADWPFVVMNNHLRSLGGIDTQSRVRLKRHEQAQSIASKVQARQQADPNLPIVLVGDKNAFQFTDGYVDVIGLLSGNSVEDQNLVNLENDMTPGFSADNQVSPGLVNALDTLPAQDRYSFIFRGIAQTLDHALLNRAANRFVSDFGYMRGNADYWVGFEDDETSIARSSDHDGFVLVLEPGRDVDNLFRDRFQAQP